MSNWKQWDFVQIIFILIGLRIVGFGSSIGDSICILALCSYLGYKAYLLSQKTHTINDKLEQELREMKANVSGLLLKNSVKPPSNLTDNKRFF